MAPLPPKRGRKTRMCLLLATTALSASFGAVAVHLLHAHAAVHAGGFGASLAPPCRLTAVELPQRTDPERPVRDGGGAGPAAVPGVGASGAVPAAAAAIAGSVTAAGWARPEAPMEASREALKDAAPEASSPPRPSPLRGVAINVVIGAPNNPANFVALLHNYAANLPAGWSIQVGYGPRSFPKQHARGFLLALRCR
jgi:hypothetical protein